MHIGWMYAPAGILTQFNIVKEAADLHSNFFCKKILHRYLTTHDLDEHIRKIVSVYRRKCWLMCHLLDDLLPQVTHSTPEGGMFLMITLPRDISSRTVFEEGIKQGVAVLPGLPFYIDGGGTDAIHMNFTTASEEQIHEGMDRLARVIADLQTFQGTCNLQGAPGFAAIFYFVSLQTLKSDVTIANLHPVRPRYCRLNLLCRVHTVRSRNTTGRSIGRDSIHDTICRILKTG